MKVLIYSDESKSDGFCSLCAVSLKEENYENISNKLREILSNHKLKELKFTEIRTHRGKIDSAKEFIKFAIENARSGKIRVDLIIWNLNDKRHRVKGRDDKENLERMYYNLLRYIAGKWQGYNDKIDFEFYPDENTEYDFGKIARYLKNTKHGKRQKWHSIELFGDNLSKFSFDDPQQKISYQEPLIQLADLFAGIGCFSRENGGLYKKWNANIEKNENVKLPLFPDSGKEDDVFLNKTKTEENRFELIKLIKDYCKKNKITISLNTYGYLRTDPFYKSEPINFWHYDPKGDYDIAPKKKK